MTVAGEVCGFPQGQGQAAVISRRRSVPWSYPLARPTRVVQISRLGARSRATHERRSPVADDTSIRPFRVNVPDEDLAELHRRIAATRFPSKELVADRSQGVQLATIQELARYWENEYGWRRCEARLNALPQFTTEIDGLNIHFIHVKSRHENALPLIMTHGW